MSDQETPGFATWKGPVGFVPVKLGRISDQETPGFATCKGPVGFVPVTTFVVLVIFCSVLPEVLPKKVPVSVWPV